MIVYRFYSTFNPARTDVGRRCTTVQGRAVQRATTTSAAGGPARSASTPEPVKLGADSLTVSGFEPATPTSETQYTTGSATNLGITASTPDGGAGFSASWTVSQSESTEIPSWSWEARPDPATKQLGWLFSARTPCDARPGGDHAICFNRSRGIGTDVKHPSETSRKTMQLLGLRPLGRLPALRGRLLQLAGAEQARSRVQALQPDHPGRHHCRIRSDAGSSVGSGSDPRPRHGVAHATASTRGSSTPAPMRR